MSTGPVIAGIGVGLLVALLLLLIDMTLDHRERRRIERGDKDDDYGC